MKKKSHRYCRNLIGQATRNDRFLRWLETLCPGLLGVYGQLALCTQGPTSLEVARTLIGLGKEQADQMSLEVMKSVLSKVGIHEPATMEYPFATPFCLEFTKEVLQFFHSFGLKSTQSSKRLERERVDLRESYTGMPNNTLRQVAQRFNFATPHRSRWHFMKHFSQEVSLCEVIAYFLKEDRCSRSHAPEYLVDFGGGNGYACWLALHYLNLSYVLNVDRYVPEMCIESNERMTWTVRDFPYYRRVAKEIQELDWYRDVCVDPARCIVMTKHLCGAGADRLLRLLETQNIRPKLIVLSTCCHNKGCLSDYINPLFLNHVLHVENAEMFSMVADRTSWIHREDQQEYDYQRSLGLLAEWLLDLGRIQRLRQRGYAADMFQFVHRDLSPRNSVLVARRIDHLLT